MSNYGEYNGDSVHDMWVDSTYSAYTGEQPYFSSNNQLQETCGRPASIQENPWMTRNRKRYKKKLNEIKELKTKIKATDHRKSSITAVLEHCEPNSQRWHKYHKKLINNDIFLASYKLKLKNLEHELITLKATVNHENKIWFAVIAIVITGLLCLFFGLVSSVG